MEIKEDQFLSKDFNEKQWLNKMLNTIESESNYENGLNMINFKLQLLQTNALNVIKMSSLLLFNKMNGLTTEIGTAEEGVKLVEKELERNEEEADSLGDLVQKNSELLFLNKELGELREVKEKLDSCRLTISEIEHFESRALKIENTLLTGNLQELCQQLDQMQTSFTVMKSLSHFENQKRSLEFLKSKLVEYLEPVLHKALIEKDYITLRSISKIYMVIDSWKPLLQRIALAEYESFRHELSSKMELSNPDSLQFSSPGAGDRAHSLSSNSDASSSPTYAHSTLIQIHRSASIHSPTNPAFSPHTFTNTQLHHHFNQNCMYLYFHAVFHFINRNLTNYQNLFDDQIVLNAFYKQFLTNFVANDFKMLCDQFFAEQFKNHFELFLLFFNFFEEIFQTLYFNPQNSRLQHESKMNTVLDDEFQAIFFKVNKGILERMLDEYIDLLNQILQVPPQFLDNMTEDFEQRELKKFFDGIIEFLKGIFQSYLNIASYYQIATFSHNIKNKIEAFVVSFSNYYNKKCIHLHGGIALQFLEGENVQPQVSVNTTFNFDWKYFQIAVIQFDYIQQFILDLKDLEKHFTSQITKISTLEKKQFLKSPKFFKIFENYLQKNGIFLSKSNQQEEIRKLNFLLNPSPLENLKKNAKMQVLKSFYSPLYKRLSLMHTFKIWWHSPFEDPDLPSFAPNANEYITMLGENIISIIQKVETIFTQIQHILKPDFYSTLLHTHLHSLQTPTQTQTQTQTQTHTHTQQAHEAQKDAIPSSNPNKRIESNMNFGKSALSDGNTNTDAEILGTLSETIGHASLIQADLSVFWVIIISLSALTFLYAKYTQIPVLSRKGAKHLNADIFYILNILATFNLPQLYFNKFHAVLAALAIPYDVLASPAFEIKAYFANKSNILFQNEIFKQKNIQPESLDMKIIQAFVSKRLAALKNK